MEARCPGDQVDVAVVVEHGEAAPDRACRIEAVRPGWGSEPGAMTRWQQSMIPAGAGSERVGAHRMRAGRIQISGAVSVARTSAALIAPQVVFSTGAARGAR